MDPDVLKYDRCANSAMYSLTPGNDSDSERQEHLVRMRERFRNILKPE